MEKWKLPPDGGHMDRPTGIYLQTMTGKEVDERLKKSDLIILPIGSTEAHGPHACSGEDTFLVTRMAEAVAQKVGCTVAEPIWYGSHPYHHLGMPGTIVVPEETFTANLRAVMAGLWNAGFRKQILLNGHGQDYAIPMAMHQFGKKYQVPMLLVNINYWFMIKEYIRDKAHGGPFETPFVHGDECETSFSMALFPEMIKLEDAVVPRAKACSDRPHRFSGSAYNMPSVLAACGRLAIEPIATPEGVVGSATLADPRKQSWHQRGVGLHGRTHQRDHGKDRRQITATDRVTKRITGRDRCTVKGPIVEGGSTSIRCVPTLDRE
jgi:creatinine amidohydrolase